MPAPSKSFTALLDAEIAAGKRITTEKMTKIRDALSHLEEWLGMDYTAAQNHNHDGVNSAEIEVGPNYIRNGSFEQGTTSWTTSAYTGGTVASNTANDMDGDTCLAITRTVLANGGGEAISIGYTPVSGGRAYDVGGMIKASVTGQSAKLSVLWYDDALGLISETSVYSTTSERTTARMIGNRVTAPATARFARAKMVGGIPATGTATGTIYFDGVGLGVQHGVAIPGDTVMADHTGDVSTTAGGYTELLNFLAQVPGTYKIDFNLRTTNGTFNAFARVYVNGVAAGTERSTGSTSAVAFSEEIDVPAGATLQVFGKIASASASTVVSNFGFKTGAPVLCAGTVTELAVGRRF